jgi:hypothetical protein
MIAVDWPIDLLRIDVKLGVEISIVELDWHIGAAFKVDALLSLVVVELVS